MSALSPSVDADRDGRFERDANAVAAPVVTVRINNRVSAWTKIAQFFNKGPRPLVIHLEPASGDVKYTHEISPSVVGSAAVTVNARTDTVGDAAGTHLSPSGVSADPSEDDVK